jgi:hypothetical protein
MQARAQWTCGHGDACHLRYELKLIEIYQTMLEDQALTDDDV